MGHGAGFKPGLIDIIYIYYTMLWIIDISKYYLGYDYANDYYFYFGCAIGVFRL